MNEIETKSNAEGLGKTETEKKDEPVKLLRSLVDSGFIDLNDYKDVNYVIVDQESTSADRKETKWLLIKIILGLTLIVVICLTLIFLTG